MSSTIGANLTGVLPFPGVGEKTRSKARVDHKTSEEAALIRRVQGGDEIAFREIVERYQSKVFSIIYGILRKKRVRKLVYESDFSVEDAQRMEASEPAVDREVLADTRLANRDLVVQLLSKVSEEDRNLILLKEVEGHSVEELAGMTGMNENTIKVKLFRARQKLLKAAQRLGRFRAAAKV